MSARPQEKYDSVAIWAYQLEFRSSFQGAGAKQYLDRHWLVHAFLEDFDLMDVCACPVAGGPTDRKLLDIASPVLVRQESHCLSGELKQVRKASFGTS